MMRIDCHTHAFADKIADKAVEQLISYYQMPTEFGGRLGDLLHQAVMAKLDALVLLVAATKPEQVKPAHDWVLKVMATDPAVLQQRYALPYLPRIIPFGTFHLDDPHWRTEIVRLRAAGIRGIKLHPEFQGIDLADPRLEPLFQEIAGEFVLLVHVGDPTISANNLSTPAKVAAIKRNFPALTIIAAHLGGYCFWDAALHDLAGMDVYLDTSSAITFIDPALLRQLVQRHGVERILLGSDYPLASPQQALNALEAISWLSPAEKSAIRGENCARLFGL